MASKKSKILAMALCASVMTGIYAAPVMAEDLSVTLDGEGIVVVGSDVTGTLTIAGADIATALTGTNLTLDSVKANTIGNTGDNFFVGADGKVSANSVTTTGDVVAGTYSLKDIGVRTQNMTATEGYTAFTGNVSASGTLTAGATTVDSLTVNGEANFTNGATVQNGLSVTGGASVDGDFAVTNGGLKVAKGIEAANGTFKLTEEGKLTVGGEATFTDKVTVQKGLTVTGGASVDGNFEVTNGGLKVAKGIEAANGTFKLTEEGKLTVGGEATFTEGATVQNGLTVTGGASVDGDFEVTNGGLKVANGIKAANGTFNLTEEGVLTVSGKATFTEGATVQNGLSVAGDTYVAGNFAVTNGGLSVSGGESVLTGGLTVNNGATKLNGNLDVGVGNFTVDAATGNTEVKGSLKLGTLPGKEVGEAIKNLEVYADELKGAKLPDKVGGIERNPESAGNPPGTGTTTIENGAKFTETAMTMGDTIVERGKITVGTVGAEDGQTIIEGGAITAKSLVLNGKDVGKTIAGIEGDPENEVTTIEGATSFTNDGMVTSNITTDSFTAGVTADSSYGINATGEMLFRSGDNYIGMDRGRIGFTSGTESVTINGEGTTFTSGDSTTRTVIKGGTITTDTLEVENIVLGNSMTDQGGNSLAIGAAGYINIKKDGETVFGANTENLTADYGDYSLSMDGMNGFALGNNVSSLTLTGSGYTFSGPVNLGAGSEVGFTYAAGTDSSKYITLDSLVDTVNDIYDRTQGISHNADGSTTIESGTRNPETGEFTSNGSKVTIGDNGATFENGEGNGATNINGGAIYANSSSIGSGSGGSGSGSSGSGSSGTYTDGSQHSGYFEDGDNSYEFTNDADGFTGTIIDSTHTTTIENGAKGSNTTVTGEGNTSASSGVGIGNDGAFISDSVTNGDISHTVNGGDITNTVTDGSITDTVTKGYMTVTEVKDENGSATTVEDANGSSTVSSTVSQDTKGQTVSTGTGISVNTGNDFGVTDNETGKSIYMSDIGHVEDIDSEIQNSDGSKTTVVDAVNNEAEIRRNEIERVDGRINNLENRVGKLEDRIDKVGAMAAAIANLRTMGYDPAAPTEVAVGIGQYRDETGAALGLFHYPNRDFMLSLSVSTSGDEVMGGIGATWKFGRKSPEKVLAAEKEKAAKEAKIKAQQERHAKLAAERAAQAEAAK